MQLAEFPIDIGIFASVLKPQVARKCYMQKQKQKLCKISNKYLDTHLIDKKKWK